LKQYVLCLNELQIMYILEANSIRFEPENIDSKIKPYEPAKSSGSNPVGSARFRLQMSSGPEGFDF